MCIVFRMATKRKRHKLTLKTKYETLKEPDKSGPSKEVVIQFIVPGSTIATWNQQILNIVCRRDCFWIFLNKIAEVATDRDDENEDEEPDKQIAHPSRNEVDDGIKTLNRLSLFTEDSGFDHLIIKLPRIINQGRRDKMWQLSINNFFKQQWIWTCYVVKNVLN